VVTGTLETHLSYLRRQERGKILLFLALPLGFLILLGTYIHFRNESVKDSGDFQKLAQRIRKQKRAGLLGGAVLLIIGLVFAWQGFQTWKADGYVSKACDALYSVGSGIDYNQQYGPGLVLIDDAQKTQLEEIQALGFKSASTDSKHYQVFSDWLGIYIDNLTGQASGTEIHDPRDLWMYDIRPVCDGFVETNP